MDESLVTKIPWIQHGTCNLPAYTRPYSAFIFCCMYHHQSNGKSPNLRFSSKTFLLLILMSKKTQSSINFNFFEWIQLFPFLFLPSRFDLSSYLDWTLIIISWLLFAHEPFHSIFSTVVGHWFKSRNLMLLLHHCEFLQDITGSRWELS